MAAAGASHPATVTYSKIALSSRRVHLKRHVRHIDSLAMPASSAVDVESLGATANRPGRRGGGVDHRRVARGNFTPGLPQIGA